MELGREHSVVQKYNFVRDVFWDYILWSWCQKRLLKNSVRKYYHILHVAQIWCLHIFMFGPLNSWKQIWEWQNKNSDMGLDNSSPLSGGCWRDGKNIFVRRQDYI